MNTLTHKGYTAKVEFDAEDEIFVGRILGINDVIGFHAENSKELRAAFEEAVEDYIETCKATGKAPEKAYSGKLMLRVPAALHRDAAIAAEAANQSLNEWSEQALAEALEASFRSYRRTLSDVEVLINERGEQIKQAVLSTRDVRRMMRKHKRRARAETVHMAASLEEFPETYEMDEVAETIARMAAHTEVRQR